jgi:hypothetical protein
MLAQPKDRSPKVRGDLSLISDMLIALALETRGRSAATIDIPCFLISPRLSIPRTARCLSIHQVCLKN